MSSKRYMHPPKTTNPVSTKRTCGCFDPCLMFDFSGDQCLVFSPWLQSLCITIIIFQLLVTACSFCRADLDEYCTQSSGFQRCSLLFFVPVCMYQKTFLVKYGGNYGKTDQGKRIKCATKVTCFDWFTTQSCAQNWTFLKVHSRVWE